MVDPSESTRLGALSESLRELVEAEKACPDPPASAQERVFARLSASLDLPADPGPAVPAPSGSASTAIGRVLAHVSRRGLATFLVGAAVGATAYGTAEHLSSRRAPAPSAVSSAPHVSEPPVTAPIPELSPSQPSVEPAASAPRADAPGTAAPASRGTRPGDGRDRGLATERKLIEMARTALTRSQINSAIATLERHAHLFPRGQLAEERESLYVQALATRGDAVHVRERARQFHQQYPHSLFAPVVDQALRSIP